MSTLQKGHLFHGRYKLVSPLGQGASAEVWMAQDTKANNLLVALKIFEQDSGIETYGMQNFEREFTTVYNMKHSNLLPPTGYDICDSRPYLVMQYCENGSCGGMVGRMDENDVIKFLHDVSAGLEYLHDHNIIHQDIKPDNILLDDNCNYLVTDFGISVSSDNGVLSSNGMSGGTRAYMGPERFEGVTNSASDMWSLGATAVEMLTGNPPYGEHGGLLQTEGEPLPQLPNLQPEVKDIIMSCLDKDPAKRIKANEIRQKINLYNETGSWKKHSRKKTIAIVVTGVISVLMCVGIFVWDYTRTKTYYYKDYAEYWGVPKGIGRLSKSDVQHREQSYKFEYNHGKLRRMSLVNSAGKVISHTDTEHMNSRYSDVEYVYSENGKIDYKSVYDQNGKMLFKMDYDNDMRTATFKRPDSLNTPMNLYANLNTLHKSGNSPLDNKSNISRYLLTFNDNGLLIERRYAALQSDRAKDEDYIYGARYKYDDKGRKIEEAYLGIDGDITANKNGLAIREYTYDDDDNWTSVTYLNSEREGSHDGNNTSHVKIKYDNYGNRIEEMYYTLDGTPSIRTDLNIAGFRYTFDEKGNCITQTGIGIDGFPAYCTNGYVTVKNSYNDDGFNIMQEFLDENGKTTLCNNPNMIAGFVKIKVNDTGMPLELEYFDENNLPLEQSNGASKIVNTFDDKGNHLSEHYFDKEGKPILINGFYHGCHYEYDDLNNLVKQYYTDIEEKPATYDGFVSAYLLEYNRQGAVTKVSNLDTNGKLTLDSDLYAWYETEYDDLGNQKSITYFGKEGKPVMTNWGYSKIEYSYDPKTNYLVSSKKCDLNGKAVEEYRYKYDSKGNIVEDYTLRGGNLKSGTAVENCEYDVNNKVIKRWWTDLSGKKVNNPGTSYAILKNEFDKNGNCVQTTYWKADGTPALNEQKAHKQVHEFDAMNRVIAEFNFGADGKPAEINPEGRQKYDQWGNIVELACYDGHGKPKLSSNGAFLIKWKYDRRGNVLLVEYLGIDEKPVNSKEDGLSKVEYAYDSRGNQAEAKYYDTNGCIRIEKYTYNDKNRLIEQKVLDGNGKLSDKDYGFARGVVEFDELGITPKNRKYYDKSGTLIASQTWNDQKSEWNDLKFSGSYASSGGGYANSSWRESVIRDARECPVQIEDGVYVQGIKCDSSSVTMTIRLSEFSKYELDSELEGKVREVMQQYKSQFRKIWNPPSNVRLSVIVTDKAGRTICVI